MPQNDLLTHIVRYEEGELEDEEEIRLFQDLIDNGMAWTLQGHYGRTAQALINAGVCHPAHKDNQWTRQ